MRIHLKKRFTALMLAGMMVTSNVLPAYSATDGIAVEQADASYEAEATAADASAAAENSEVWGGVSSEQGDAGKPVIDADDTDSTTDASGNAASDSASSTAASADAGDESHVADAAAGEQTTTNKSEATDGAAMEESKSDAANGTVTEESKADAGNGAATEESKSDAANGIVTEESKSDAGHGTGAEESKADAVHGSNAGGSSVVGAGSVDIDESTGAAVEIEETKPGELLEEETKLATESEIPKEEDEKKLEEKENRKTIYIAFGKGVKVTATLEDANAVPDDARLRVTEIDDDEMYAAYLEAMDEAEPEIEHTKDNTVLRDISFIMKDENGKEIEYEPTEGSVKITIEYLENHLQDWFGVEDAAEVKTYHLPLAEGVKAEGEKTIDVQNVKASDINVQELDSDVKTEKTVEVEVDSFSMFAMRRAQARTTSSTPIELKDITSSIKITTNGNISRDTPFTLNMHFDVDDNRLLDTVKTENESGESVIRNVWEYDLSEFVASQPLNIINGISGDLYEGNEITGSYKVENNKITFTVKQEFLKDKTQGVNGNFSFEAQLNKKMIGTEKEYTFTFPGSATGVTVVFPKKAEASKTCDSGSGDVTFEKINEDGSIILNYTLKFKANAAVKNLELRDELIGPQNYKEDSFKLSENWYPVYNNLGDALTFSTDRKSITLDVCKALNITNTTADSEYILQYSTIVNKEDIGQNLRNRAQWSWDGGQTTDGGTTSITPHKKLQVRKSVENKNGEYHYTITVGGEGVNMRGHKITDTMSDNQVLDGDITISPDINGIKTITPDDKNYSQKDTKLFEYIFPNDQDCIGTYTITYKTKPAKSDQLTGTQDIKNRVTDEHNGDRGEASSENQKHNFGVQQMARITKSWAGFNTDAKAVLWNIKVELPKGCTELHNVIVTELMAGCGENQWYRPYIMTFDLSHVAIKKTDGTPYEGSHSIIEDGKSIKFENLTSSIVIEGVRTVCSDDHDYTNTEKASFYNKAGVTVDGKPGQDSWAEKTFADWSMSKYVTEDKATGEFNWTVTVNPEKADLREEKNLIFEDEIPEGMELVGGLKITTDGWSSNGKRYDRSWVWPEIKVSNKTGKIHVDITSQLDGTKVNNGGTIYNIETPAGISGVRYTISYKTKLTGEAQKQEKENPHQVFSYENVARVVDQGGDKIKGDATATVEHKYKYFTKTDTSPETLTADIIEYQIVINPDALTLNGGKDLTLTDILPEGTQFISNGYNFIPEGSCKNLGLDSGTRTLTVVVPDSRRITFTYKLKSDNLYPDWSGHVFTNYAELSGTGKQVINVEKKHIIKKHAANITGSTSSIHIHKYDEDNTHTSLSGAEFKLYRLKVSEDGTLTKDGTDSVATATTDKNSGKLTFKNLTPVNNASTAAPYYAYKFVETKAPEGYAINEKYDDKHGCYFVFYEGEDENADKKAQEVKTLIENKNKDKKLEVKVVPGAYTFEVSNKKPSTPAQETIEISGEKVWNDANNQDGLRPNEITVDLYANNKKVEGKTVTVTALSDWKYGWSGLEKLDKAGKEIAYTVVERSVPAGYKSSAPGDKNNDYKITNTHTPETTSITVQKVWSDNNDQDGKRPKTITVKLMKQLAGSETIEDANRQKVLDEAGEWKATFDNLPVYESGKKITYTVTEEAIPGYVLTDSKSSTEDGKIVVQLTNKSIDFKVNKFERTGTRELDGAKIQIKDSTGAVIAEWISKSGETHDFGSKLKAGETYTIHEETAPSGYYTISDMNFTVGEKGEITLAGSSDDVKLEDGVIKICDERIKSSGGGGGGDHPHPLPETTPAETTPAETTVPETTPVETTNPGGGHGGPSEEVETDEYGRVRGANRNKNKKGQNGQDGGNVKGANRGKTRTGDESMMSIFGFGFLAAVLVLLGWFGIRFTKRNRR
ncbi:Cna B-type domain-containing protein [Oribacterium sp. HCP3S3_B9]|uniref:Cna B-type domain-containing protein n=1 Tax=Oribacterium sp. HCP3S3_B9 TaxID=3438946 RepID=UPI003F8C7CC2